MPLKTARGVNGPRTVMAIRSTVRQTNLFGAAQSGLPAGLRYEPDFITSAEEQELVSGIRALPLHEAQYKQFLEDTKQVTG